MLQTSAQLSCSLRAILQGRGVSPGTGSPAAEASAGLPVAAVLLPEQAWGLFWAGWPGGAPLRADLWVICTSLLQCLACLSSGFRSNCALEELLGCATRSSMMNRSTSDLHCETTSNPL